MSANAEGYLGTMKSMRLAVDKVRKV